MRWKDISAGIGATLFVSMLIVGTLGLVGVIGHCTIVPPQLDLHIGGFRILAVITSPAHSPPDDISMPCAPKRGTCCMPKQELYLVWVLAKTGAIARDRPISTRVLTLLLPYA